MILGIGIDICPIDRIAGVLKRQGRSFEKRVFTEEELAYSDCAQKNEKLAARWAAKEAAIKALGGVSGIDWLDMEVTNTDKGVPQLSFKGGARAHAVDIGTNEIHISLSHAGGVAVAVVILEG